MLDKNGAIIQSLVEIVDKFGFDYVKKHRNAPYCYREENNDTVFVTFLFQEKEEKSIISDYLGWSVYATVCVNLNTSDAFIVDAITPNGTKITKELK